MATGPTRVLALRQQLTGEIEQQVELEVEPHQIGGMRGFVVLLGEAVFLERIAGLQHPQIAVRQVAGGDVVDLFVVRHPAHGQKVFVGQFLEQDGRVGGVDHVAQSSEKGDIPNYRELGTGLERSRKGESDAERPVPNSR